MGAKGREMVEGRKRRRERDTDRDNNFVVVVACGVFDISCLGFGLAYAD